MVLKKRKEIVHKKQSVSRDSVVSCETCTAVKGVRACVERFERMKGDVMKCATLKAFGDVEKELEIVTDRPRPVLDKDGKGKMLVKVLACALAPGDVRVLTGACDLFQAPKSFPYIPGGDICAVVEEVNRDVKFKKGDVVFVLFHAVPFNGLAEYAIVQADHAAKKPKNISALEAACIPSSALTAMLAVENFVKKGDRVMVLGGSGGVGTTLVQLTKHAGASFVAATSTQNDLLKSLGVDRVIDYRETNWWEMPEFKERPFDLVFDLVGGRDLWLNARSGGALKGAWGKNGRYITFATDTPKFIIHNYWQACALFAGAIGRNWWTTLSPTTPKWKWHIGLSIWNGSLNRLAAHVEEGHFKVVMDPQSPFPLTYTGVKDAYLLQGSGHAHGKVVVQIQDETNPAETVTKIAATE